MFLKTGYMRTQDMLEKGLDAALRRREIIADNIANVDVPNFKRSELIFESMLKRALDEEQRIKEEAFPTILKHKKHIPFDRAPDWRNVKPKTNIDYLTIMRTDGNNVDMEKEMTLALENQLRYNIMSQILANNFRKLNIVLRPSI
jgi:flagellar basal-body rod protein FlgB